MAARRRRRRLKKRTRRQLQGWGAVAVAAVAVAAALWVARHWSVVWPVLVAVLATAVVGGAGSDAAAIAPSRGRPRPRVAIRIGSVDALATDLTRRDLLLQATELHRQVRAPAPPPTGSSPWAANWSPPAPAGCPR